LKQVGDKPQQSGRSIGAFAVESIGNYASGTASPALSAAAHGDNQYRREAAADYREEFKSWHLRHIQIGNDQLRNLTLHLQKRFETVFRDLNLVPFIGQQHRDRRTNARIVIHD
jgi:hypothetical protein